MFLAPDQAAAAATAWSSITTIGHSAAPVMAIDLRATLRAAIGVPRHDLLLEALIAPPWVTVALVDAELHPSLVKLADRCDIVLGLASNSPTAVDVADPVAELEALRSAVQASPRAAVALVQLLRLTESSPVALALHAESLTYATLQTSETFRRWLAARPPTLEPTAALDHSATLSPAGSQIVAVERVGDTLYIRLDRAHKHNALNLAMRDQLTQALELLDTDRSLGGAILAGNGPNFCAGGDLDEFGTTPSPAMGHHVRAVRSLPRLMHRVADRLRVHLHGSCIGAGIELPAFAHSVIAHPDATFRLPEVGFGLVPGAGGTVSVSRRCGRHRTAWWALRGTSLDTQTARSWGLIDRIDPAVRHGS